MTDITSRINDSLKNLYNIEDEVYKALICDADGVIPSQISKPSDIDIGAMASMIEYLRILSQNLLTQMYMDQSSDDFLSFCLEEYFNIIRLDGETDETWISRAKGVVFQPKVSRAALTKLLRPYSTQEPTIVQASKYCMFADYSFASRYKTANTQMNGKNVHVFPAIAETYEDTCFAIVVTLVGTTAADCVTVVDILSKSVAAGIYYSVQIQS